MNNKYDMSVVTCLKNELTNVKEQLAQKNNEIRNLERDLKDCKDRFTQGYSNIGKQSNEYWHENKIIKRRLFYAYKILENIRKEGDAIVNANDSIIDSAMFILGLSHIPENEMPEENKKRESEIVSAMS